MKGTKRIQKSLRKTRKNNKRRLQKGGSCDAYNKIPDLFNVTLCNINPDEETGEGKKIEINGDGKCGWYSIFVYLKLLYLKYPEHFNTTSVLEKIKKYFEKNHLIFTKGESTPESISVIGSKSGDEKHFLQLMKIFSDAEKENDGEKYIGAEYSINETIKDLENFVRVQNRRKKRKINEVVEQITLQQFALQQFEYPKNAYFISKHIHVPIYLIDINDRIYSLIHDKIEVKKIPPIILIYDGKHYDLLMYMDINLPSITWRASEERRKMERVENDRKFENFQNIDLNKLLKRLNAALTVEASTTTPTTTTTTATITTTTTTATTPTTATAPTTTTTTTPTTTPTTTTTTTTATTTTTTEADITENINNIISNMNYLIEKYNINKECILYKEFNDNIKRLTHNNKIVITNRFNNNKLFETIKDAKQIVSIHIPKNNNDVIRGIIDN